MSTSKERVAVLAQLLENAQASTFHHAPMNLAKASAADLHKIARHVQAEAMHSYVRELLQGIIDDLPTYTDQDADDQRATVEEIKQKLLTKIEEHA